MSAVFKIPVRVAEVRNEGSEIVSLILNRIGGKPLPEYEPGGHVTIDLPNGLNRSYSLSNAKYSPTECRITVARGAAEGGGSSYLHNNVRVGDILEMTPPANNFCVDRLAPYSIFFAGGIGITPFISMIAALNEMDASWTLYYCAKSPKYAAHLGEIEEFARTGPGKLITHFTNEGQNPRLSVGDILQTVNRDTHIYCCGPGSMLEEFREHAARLQMSAHQTHFEYFANDIEKLTTGFTVVLKTSGEEIYVTPGTTILESLEALGFDLPHSCREGVCGLCETAVIDGIPDHRDRILSEHERQASRTMMICCSGAKTARLTLDL